ncbi:MAG: urea ABC transporter ATP-binding protein UrtD [Aphanocapsa feldmannii 277cV]|uniref:Urea ABC transporter ATP-binding protein UrtD n=2 Tax=Aphanocapsa feldmannii TaxID=192050 RepID=A0A524RKV6_9CHRO|nr:MAG: urea ABC transporter ATP-binding protein UrtD [Aphanocapsa feldmannii 288cV]TGG90486.1 MAG: urea ABC transporter ATP-binding protein UrtD [Aphanocapsa feldmannii 277cV]TGH27537.1 MAG: urea ABC transporter ATP-binding protein UrtD [Aphanocapsa feldmannii 277cI]
MHGNAPIDGSAPLLELDGVSVDFDGFLALDDLSLCLASGELRAVIGPNGAGKTTFLDVITGKLLPSSGDVRFKGRSLLGQQEHHIARLGVGRKFQSPRVFENLSLRQNLTLAASVKTPLALLFGSLGRSERDRVEHLLGVIDLADRPHLLAGELSHGQKQWLEIAMLVAQDPDLLLVDEPVAGLTDGETERTADLLRELAGDHTVLVIDHDMEFIRRLDAPVTVLHEGHVLCEGTMDQVQCDPAVTEVYLGRADETP